MGASIKDRIRFCSTVSFSRFNRAGDRLLRHLPAAPSGQPRGAVRNRRSIQHCATQHAEKWDTPTLETPRGRRDEFAEPTSAPPHYQIVVLLKTRELERIMTPVGDRKTNRWHLQGRRALSSAGQPLHQRSAGERMFVRMCPYLSVSARV